MRRGWRAAQWTTDMKQNDPSHALLEDAQELGHEARAGNDDRAALKL